MSEEEEKKGSDRKNPRIEGILNRVRSRKSGQLTPGKDTVSSVEMRALHKKQGSQLARKIVQTQASVKKLRKKKNKKNNNDNRENDESDEDFGSGSDTDFSDDEFYYDDGRYHMKFDQKDKNNKKRKGKENENDHWRNGPDLLGTYNTPKHPFPTVKNAGQKKGKSIFEEEDIDINLEADDHLETVRSIIYYVHLLFFILSIISIEIICFKQGMCYQYDDPSVNETIAEVFLPLTLTFGIILPLIGYYTSSTSSFYWHLFHFFITIGTFISFIVIGSILTDYKDSSSEKDKVINNYSNSNTAQLYYDSSSDVYDHYQKNIEIIISFCFVEGFLSLFVCLASFYYLIRRSALSLT